ncbi:hypothetical protein CPB86DRAFT_798936 [Serendipita vermifera]|nr:hypothetical protein CPB86DRAFT_798936 [Serendipita vermifera]
MAGPQSQVYTIFCVLYDDPESPFYVEVDPSVTLAKLNEEIVKKRPNALRKIDPASLKLYQVDIPDQENVIRDTMQSLSKSSIALRPTTKLSYVYASTPPEATIHFVVQCSSTNFTQKRKLSPSNCLNIMPKRFQVAKNSAELIPIFSSLGKEDYSRKLESPIRSALHLPPSCNVISLPHLHPISAEFSKNVQNGHQWESKNAAKDVVLLDFDCVDQDVRRRPHLSH